MFTRLLAIFALAFTCCAAWAQEMNFAGRQALIANLSPHVQLSDFSFSNWSERPRDRFHMNLTWKNIADKPVVAFEVVILKYDAFDQRMVGTRWTITGKNSANWAPLGPGDISSDGTIGYTTEEVFTAIAYVRNVRLGDGTVWRASEFEVLSAIKKLAPGIKDPGSLKPDAKPDTKN